MNRCSMIPLCVVIFLLLSAGVSAISTVFGLRLPGAVALSSHRAIVPGSSAVRRGSSVISSDVSSIRRLNLFSQGAGISNDILVAFSGNPSDTDEIWSELQLQASEYTTTHSAPISPRIVANLCRKLMISRRRSGIYGAIVAGMHLSSKEGAIPELYSIDDWGTMTESDCAAAGPDAPLLLGLLDKGKSTVDPKDPSIHASVDSASPSSPTVSPAPDDVCLQVVRDCWRVLRSSSAGHIGPADVAYFATDARLQWKKL